MTILSKKKSNTKQNEDTSESSSHNGASTITLQNSVTLESSESHGLQHQQYSPTSNTPPHHMWPSPSSAAREEKRPPHGTPPHYEDMLENSPNVGKRRHRASPHRTPRSKHRERVNSPPSACHLSASPVVNSRPQPARAPSSRPPTPSAGPSGSGYLDEASGYNSEDEYGMVPCLTEEEWAERDRRFEKRLRKKGWIIKQMGEDGACLFRAVADQVFGDQEMHSIVRNQCMDFLLLNQDHYKQYMTEDLEAYVTRKRNDFVHGNHIELQALSEMFNRAIEVFSYSIEPINMFHGITKPDNEPIRLSYHRGVHYNSIVDPYKATIGVGLGLPNFTPGLADNNLMQEAVRQSEECVIEQAMLEDKLMATDWEATDEVLAEQAARESYLQWLKDNEKRNKALHRTSSATTSATVTSSENRPTRSGISQRPCESSSDNSIHQHVLYPKMSKENRCSTNCPCSGPLSLHLPLPLPQSLMAQHSKTSKSEDKVDSKPTSPKSCTSKPLSSKPCCSKPCCSKSCSLKPCTSLSCSSVSAKTSSSATSLDTQLEYLSTCQAGPSNSANTSETDLSQTSSYSFLGQVPPEMLGLSGWEDDAKLLAGVLATSQEEYLDSLKRTTRDDQSSINSQSSSSS